MESNHEINHIISPTPPIVQSNVFRPINYLGSKLRILDFIETHIDDIDTNKGLVCDLFAGSGSVSYRLSRTRPTISVDIQEYSRVICSALLIRPTIPDEFIYEFLSTCKISVQANKLFAALEDLIHYEKCCIEDAVVHKNLESLCELVESGSIISYQLLDDRKANSSLKKHLASTISRLSKIAPIDSLAIRYFGGLYFSYEQAVIIDSILHNLQNAPALYKDTLLAALVGSVSECVNTVGKQFAQPLRPRSSSGQIKPSLGKIVQKDRSIDFYLLFEKWFKRYSDLRQSTFKHEVLRLDFKEALDSLPKDVSVVYADPPYTRDHYSRFYHVLETLSIRDLPQISTMKLNGKTVLSRALYRESRHQSPFCIKSQAPEAFNALFQKCSKREAKLVLSYSPFDQADGSHPRVVTMEQLMVIAKKYYRNVDCISTGSFTHSKLNHTSKHLLASTDAEILIVCTN